MNDDVRARLRTARRSIPADEQYRRADAAAAQAATLPWWPAVSRLGLYRAVAGELDTAAIERWASDRGISTFVPVLTGDRLRFARATSGTVWSPNRFGIDEPADVEPIEATSLDLVIVPAVAVDRSGNRLGMGGGFYDRTFAGRTPTDRPGRPVLVAAVHPEQIVARLAAQPWDIPMNAIITPDEVILVESSGGCGPG